MLTDREMFDLFGGLEIVQEPDPAFLDATLNRLERERRRRSRPWSLIARLPVARNTGLDPGLWLALAVSLLLALALASSFAGGQRSLPTLSLASPTEPRATGVALPPVGQLVLIGKTGLSWRPRAIVLDSRGIAWVANGDQVTEIDPRTGDLGRSVSLGPGAASVIEDSSMLWVANRGADLVGRVDPVTATVQATVGVDAPEAIAVDGTAVWVLSGDASTVSRIDSVRMVVTLEFEVPPGSSAIAIADGAVWVGRETAGELSGSFLDRFDGNTGQPVTSLAYAVQAYPPDRIVITGGFIWLADISTGRIVRIDPASNEQTTVPVGPIPKGLVAGPNGILAVGVEVIPGIDLMERNGVTIYDPSTDQTTRFAVRADSAGAGGGVVALAFGDSLWVAMDWLSDPSVGRFVLP